MSELPVTTQHELLITSNFVNRSSTEEGAILGDIMGAGLTIESDLSITDFPNVGSCLLDLQPPPAGFNNRFQVIAANIDSWRTNVKLNLSYIGSTIADLMTTSNSIS